MKTSMVPNLSKSVYQGSTKCQTTRAVVEQTTHEKEETIKQLTRLNWETYQNFLVKQHSQWMTLRCLTTSTQNMVPALLDAIFAEQLKSTISQPPQLKPMIDICNLKDHVSRLTQFKFKGASHQFNSIFSFIFSHSEEGCLNPPQLFL